MYKVVVADDEIEFRAWLRALLSSCDDFQVVGEACTGEETLSLVKKLNPDLVIADLYMPEPDGLEIARFIQEHYPEMKAILVSAHRERICEKLARDEGALAFIPKAGLSLGELRHVLES
jgi:two-component system response regulator YesN